jgi:hypothetical protein
MTFQFKTSRARKIETQPFTLPKVLAEQEPPPGLIQGQQAGSVQEWRTALALNRMKLDYDYQYSIEGGRTAGGQVIDFLVDTVPMRTPLLVQGDYYHSNSMDPARLYKIAEIERVFRGQINKPVEVWEHELTSMEQAYQTVKERLLG